MPKNLITIVFLVLYFATFVCKAQVTMNLVPPPPIGVTLKNVLDPIIINGQKGSYTVYIIGTVSDVNGKELAEFRTNYFNLKTGLTNVNYTDIGLLYQNYMDVEFQSDYEKLKYFPIGNFTLCATLMQFETEKALAQTCVNTRVLPLQPPRLVYPIDSSKIRIPDPIFSWLPVTGPGVSQSSIQYELTVSEILEGQSCEEAISSNPGLLIANNLSTTFYPYPSTALNTLNFGQQYAWQVKAYSGDYFLGQSEIWDFKLVKDSVKLKPIDSSYALLKKNQEGGYCLANRYLNFEYRGVYNNEKELNFQIYDDHMRVIKRPGKKYIKQHGINQYSIDLSDYKHVKKNNFYILQVSDEKGQKYYLRFKYVRI